jgi:predicted Zn-dependent protease
MKIHLIYKESFPQHYLDAAAEGIAEMYELAQKDTDIIDDAKPSENIADFENHVYKEQVRVGWNNRKLETNLLLRGLSFPEVYSNIFNMNAPEPDDKVIYLMESDLYAKGTYWVFGSAMHLTGRNVQSVYRIEHAQELYKNFPSMDDTYKSFMFKTLIMHEAGHLLGLTPDYLPNHTESKNPIYHRHCKHKYCVMSQDASVRGWVKKTDLRINRAKKDLPPLCPGCYYELLHNGQYEQNPEGYMRDLKEYSLNQRNR